MAESESGSKWGKVIFIIILIIIVLMILIGLVVGLKGLKSFFTWLIGGILFLGILFGLLYVFWLIFLKKEFKDIPAQYRKKLTQTARLMKNEMLGNLYLSGDSKHNRIKLGKFAYLRMTLPKQTREEKEIVLKPSKINNPFQDKKEINEYTEPVPVDCFVIIKTKLIDRLFGQPIFVLVKPEDHNYSSIFNDVTINGFNLVPLDSQFYTIDKRDIDVDIIKGVAQNYISETVYEIFRDLDRLVKQAMNLDQQFQKDKERGMEFQIPQLPMTGGGGHNQ